MRRDVAEALIAQGITVLRYGGSMVNHEAYRWKKMIGPPDRRPPYSGTWYRYSSNGWGIPDFMNFCEAAGFEYIPAFNMGETPQDMGDFIEYATGPAATAWGRNAPARRPSAALSACTTWNLATRNAWTSSIPPRFQPIAEAIWAKDPQINAGCRRLPITGRSSDPLHFAGGAVSTLACGTSGSSTLPKPHNREVWFDVHINTDAPPAPGDLAGPRSFFDQLQKLSPGGAARSPFSSSMPGTTTSGGPSPMPWRSCGWSATGGVPGRHLGQLPPARRAERQRLGPGTRCSSTRRRSGCNRRAT